MSAVDEATKARLGPEAVAEFEAETDAYLERWSAAIVDALQKEKLTTPAEVSTLRTNNLK